jgi:hypothetical protein
MQLTLQNFRINLDEITKRLRGLGFQVTGAAQDLYLSVNSPQDKEYYVRLLEAVQQIVKELDATLH